VTNVDTSQRGMDRRTLIKRSAAAGAIAWAAPTVVAGPAYAVDFIPGTTCTLKCVPEVNLNLLVAAGLGTWLECVPGPPGQQGVIVRIDSFELTAGSSAACPCGGNPEFQSGSGGPIVGQEYTALFQPGNGLVTFEIPVTVTCTDRSGDRISITCRIQAVGRTTGNCQSNGGNQLALQFLGLGCSGTPVCNEAQPE
jgi:hypothetical protein